jgi:hypothetical protein
MRTADQRECEAHVRQQTGLSKKDLKKRVVYPLLFWICDGCGKVHSEKDMSSNRKPVHPVKNFCARCWKAYTPAQVDELWPEQDYFRQYFAKTNQKLKWACIFLRSSGHPELSEKIYEINQAQIQKELEELEAKNLSEEDPDA